MIVLKKGKSFHSKFHIYFNKEVQELEQGISAYGLKELRAYNINN